MNLTIDNKKFDNVYSITIMKREYSDYQFEYTYDIELKYFYDNNGIDEFDPCPWVAKYEYYKCHHIVLEDTDHSIDIVCYNSNFYRIYNKQNIDQALLYKYLSDSVFKYYCVFDIDEYRF